MDKERKWKLVSECLPPVEKPVELTVEIRRERFTTIGFYEDGNVLDNDSKYFIDSYYDEERGTYIVYEGWYEWSVSNETRCLSDYLDSEVIAWRELDEPFKR